MNNTSGYIRSKQRILSIYCTADYPQNGDTGRLLLALQAAGADMVEIGIPFSDPLADGPVIQLSSQKALQNGFVLKKMWEDLGQIKEDMHLPMVMMGYFNTVLQYGVEAFLSNCHMLKMDTVIIPDLPPEVYVREYRQLFHQYGVSPVFLFTPQTPTERIYWLSGLTEAFLYAVSDNSITGNTTKTTDQQLTYFEKISRLKLAQPVMIGFGISEKAHYEIACQYADGAIVGSAFLRTIGRQGTSPQVIREFIQSYR